MSCSSSLIDIPDGLVLDTSVLINLNACSYGARVLTAIPNDIVVPQIVAGELEHETSRKNGEYSFLHNLLSAGIVSLATLSDAEYEIFHELAATSPSLGDGEAATIAVAAVKGLLPVIDDKRGRGRATAFAQGREPCWSIDLFRHPATIAALGVQLAIDALYLALRVGRMRVPPESADGVIALLGMERSRDCTCLPDYRGRFANSRDSRGANARLLS
jgi:predicted nucleic acid-binding protein